MDSKLSNFKITLEIHFGNRGAHFHNQDWFGTVKGNFDLSIDVCCFNVDALAQASDFRIDRTQVVIICWMQDSIPEGLWNRISSRLNARWQTDWDIEDQIKIWTRQPVPMISELGRGYRPYGDGESDGRADGQIMKWLSVVGQMRDYNLKHCFVNFSRLNDV